MWDCWAVVEFILPLICSHNDVGIVGLVLSTVVLVSLPFLWGNVLESQQLREFMNHLDGEVDMYVADVFFARVEALCVQRMHKSP